MVIVYNNSTSRATEEKKRRKTAVIECPNRHRYDIKTGLPIVYQMLENKNTVACSLCEETGLEHEMFFYHCGQCQHDVCMACAHSETTPVLGKTNTSRIDRKSFAQQQFTLRDGLKDTIRTLREEFAFDDESFSTWYTVLKPAQVRTGYATSSRIVTGLEVDSRVRVVERKKNRVRIDSPIQGWCTVLTQHDDVLLLPEDPEDLDDFERYLEDLRKHFKNQRDHVCSKEGDCEQSCCTLREGRSQRKSGTLREGLIPHVNTVHNTVGVSSNGDAYKIHNLEQNLAKKTKELHSNDHKLQQLEQENKHMKEMLEKLEKAKQETDANLRKIMSQLPTPQTFGAIINDDDLCAEGCHFCTVM